MNFLLFVTLVIATSGAAGGPSVAIENRSVAPGQTLRVWVSCAPGTGAGDLQSKVTQYMALDRQPNGRWYAAPRVAAAAQPGAYPLQVRCTPGPGSPYTTSVVTFHVVTPQRWSAASNTAMSVTGDVKFTPSSLVFANGKRLAIRYLKDVSRSVSYASDVPASTHAELYRVLSPSDVALLRGNSLCGQRPTYVSVLYRTSSAPNGTDIFLTVYSGDAEPTGTSRDTICAGYTYSAP